MTLKNKLLSHINSDFSSFVALLKAKDFIASKQSETNKNVVFMKRSGDFVCCIDFLCTTNESVFSDKYGDIIFYLYEKTNNGYKTWTSMFGNHFDKEAVIIKQFLE